MDNLQILSYTQERMEDVLDFERRLREGAKIRDEGIWIDL